VRAESLRGGGTAQRFENGWREQTPDVLVAADLAVAILVVASTVVVVVVVLGLHVWGAIQDGREEKAMRWRRRGGGEGR